MSINFSQLAKKKVHIGIGDGKWVEVPMLCMDDFLKFRDIQKRISKMAEGMPEKEQSEKLMEAREEMVEMAKKVLPLPIRENIYRLDFMQLTALVLVLCTGKDDSEDDAPEKKTVLEEQVQESSELKSTMNS